MTPLALAFLLFAQDPAATPAAPAEPVPAVEEDRLPTGAPKDDYQFVAWCYGSLRGYLDMHDEMMPEVTRIERQFRKPGTSLADDLKVYADMQKDGQAKLKSFQSALTAAERASVRPINVQGAAAVRAGRMSWTTGPDVTRARKAQEWMSWALPVRCERVSAQLEQRSRLMGSALKANAPRDESPPPSATEEQAAPPEKAPATETPPTAAN
ncbi:MAG: hypothetical protein JNL41_06210 [Phenylobacterium sp.]|uniref:hypothetical protein n=1 Tax=Phenylobacterium sp. TaxID=1871053 RepID=UPI001A3F0F70|nr:hypothetical protein [Phenylobacterium sp.]MBL8553854.1 hypothetical protein [Phenylobacterium sp.]